MWLPIEQWWQQRTQREQRLLTVAAGLLIILSFYLLLLRPLHAEHQRAHKRLLVAQQQWQWLNEQIEQHPHLLQHPQTRLTGPQLVLWFKELSRSLALNAQIRHKNNRVVLQFESASSKAVADLLNQLQTRRVQVLELSLSQDGGQVQGRIEVVP